MTQLSMQSDKRSGTLERGLAVLEQLASAGRTSPARLAEALGLSRSATYRILGTLREAGYVEWDEPGERVGLGFKVVQLGMAGLNALEPVAAATAHLRDLARETGESVLLAVRDGDQMVYVVHEDPRGHSIAMRPLLGTRRDLHSTSLGKAFLAALPVDECDELLARLPLDRYTDTTITDVAQLRRHLDAVRLLGHAIDEGENEPGVRCFGAAVRDHLGRPVCAISVAGPEQRMNQMGEELGRLVGDTALAISRRLGYTGR